MVPRLAIGLALLIPVGAMLAFLGFKFSGSKDAPPSVIPAPGVPPVAAVEHPSVDAETTTKPTAIEEPVAVQPQTSPAPSGDTNQPSAAVDLPAASQAVEDIPPGEVARFAVEGGDALTVAFSPDGKQLVYGAETHHSRIYFADLTTKTITRSSPTAAGTITGLCFLPTGTDESGLQVWSFDTGASRPLGAAFAGLRSVALSEDGTQLLTAGDQGRITLWQLPGGTKVREFQKAHTGVVKSIAFASQAKLALSGGDDRVVRLWDVETGESVARFTGHTNSIYTVAISTDGRIGMSGSEDRTIRVWDLVRRQERACLKIHEDAVRGLAISTDSRMGISAGADRMIWIYDLQNGRSIHRLEGHKNTIRAVALSPDGQFAATASQDRTVRVWRLPGISGSNFMDGPAAVEKESETQAEEAALRAESIPDLAYEFQVGLKAFGAVDFSADSRQAAVNIEYRAVAVYDLTSGKEVRRFNDSPNASSLAFLPDGKRLAAAGYVGGLVVWDCERGTTIREPFQVSRSTMTDLAASSDGKTVAIIDVNRKLFFFEPATGQVSAANSTSMPYLSACAFLSSGSSVVLGGGSASNEITLWGISQGSTAKCSTGVSRVYDVAVAFDDTTVAVVGTTAKSGSSGKQQKGSGILELWNIKKGSKIRSIGGQPCCVRAVAFTPDGRHLLTGGGEEDWSAPVMRDGNEIRIWDVGSGREVYRFAGHGKAVTRLVVSPDGRYLGSVGHDARVRIWRMPDALVASPAGVAVQDNTVVDLSEISKNLNTVFVDLIKENKVAEAAELLRAAEAGLRAYARQNNVKFWDRKIAPLMRRADERQAELAEAQGSGAIRRAAGTADDAGSKGSEGADSVRRPRTELNEEELRKLLAMRSALNDLNDLIRAGKLSLARTRLNEVKGDLEDYVRAQNLAEWQRTVSAVFQLAEQRQSELDARDKVDRERLEKAARELKEKEEAARRQAEAKTTEGVPVGQAAPDIQGLMLDGKPFNSAVLKGKWVLVDFWATWCGPCVAEMPNIEKVFKAFGKDKRFAIVSLSIDKNPEDLQKFLASKEYGWYHVFLPGGSSSPVYKAWNVHGIPRILLVDPRGRITANGLRGEAIQQAVSEALSDK
jgi:WD40 repeat protein/thiol-disulfide isomerase/thioredoxin